MLKEQVRTHENSNLGRGETKRMSKQLTNTTLAIETKSLTSLPQLTHLPTSSSFLAVATSNSISFCLVVATCRLRSASSLAACRTWYSVDKNHVSNIHSATAPQHNITASQYHSIKASQHCGSSFKRRLVGAWSDTHHHLSCVLP